ncbi:hypothetical protein BaRGS_00016845, partial [Batillaria attramentaria]
CAEAFALGYVGDRSVPAGETAFSLVQETATDRPTSTSVACFKQMAHEAVCSTM